MKVILICVSQELDSPNPNAVRVWMGGPDTGDVTETEERAGMDLVGLIKEYVRGMPGNDLVG